MIMSSKFLMVEYLRFMHAVDYEKPHVKTVVPGPKTLELMCKHAKHSNDDQFLRTMIDMKKSKGNFFKDHDNNTILDLVMSGG